MGRRRQFVGTDAMKSPEFSKFMNQATSSSAALRQER